MSCQGTLREELFHNSTLAAAQWQEIWQEINQLLKSKDATEYKAAYYHPFFRKNRWRSKLGWPFISWRRKEKALDALRELHRQIDDRREFEQLFLQLENKAKAARMKIVTGVTGTKLIDTDDNQRSSCHIRNFPYSPVGLKECLDTIECKQIKLNLLMTTLTQNFGYTERQFARFAETHDKI